MVSSVLQSPSLLNGRYSLKETLGVRLGRRTLLGYDHRESCPVIVKYLCYDDPIHALDRARFDREVTLLRRLDHPAIPKFADYFEVDTATHRGLMLVQRYVPGTSLFHQLQRGKTFDEAALKDLAHQVLDILDYLHQQTPTVVHRDLKPSNLVVSSEQGTQRLYLVDFGLVQTDQTDALAMAGSPGYQPPEQLGDRATPASDLYALGMTLIHLATGQHPTTLPHRGLRVLFAQDLGHISRPFKHWLRWLSEPRQEKRPQSIAEARQVLREVDAVFAKRLPAAMVTAVNQQRQQLFEALNPRTTRLRLESKTDALEVVIPTVRFRGFDRSLWPTVRSSLWGMLGLGAVALALVIIANLAVTALTVPYGWSVLAIATLFGLLLTAANTVVLWRSLTSLAQRFQRRVHIQLEADVLLVGYASPLQPIQYVINARRQDVFDIDLRPDKTRLHVFLMRNRTRSGQLNYSLTATELGLDPTEMRWLSDLLHVWLKRTSPMM